MVFERVEFLSDKSLFKGKVYRPENLDRCKGSVIFTHGLGYCDRQYKIEGEHFAQNGYLMLTYNLRAHAGTPGKWTLENSVEDLIEGINFLVQKYDFSNKERICVIGHSTGALITLLASLRDKRIKFGSVVTTVTCLKDSYQYWFKSGFNKEVKEYFKTKGVIPPIIEKFMDDPAMIERYREKTIPKEDLEIPHRYGMLRSDSWNDFFYEIVYSVDIIESAGKLTLPLLLFRGENDEVMDVQKTHDLYEKLPKSNPSKLFLTRSQNHFHNDSWDIIQSKTLQFFDEFCSCSESRKDLRNKDILIIDDEPLVIRTLEKLLKKNPFLNPVVASSGDDALRKIVDLKRKKNKEFDLIISDIRMPGIDGIETVKRVKKVVAEFDGHESPVIFITGYEGENAEQRAKAVGYVDYLYKPLDMENFLSTIRKHLLC